ncbi:MAG: hypothetical protein UW39_C0022G0015 [Parcubacteria group bacterium GW2011_GWC2_44_17]|uniref:Uncharacterized protein n=1 Tax=Candidatus Jacksonbacteria bacterium RIFCSPLOWO2_02_FULL_44_20 TaxID=1798460 RepID=A0A1G2AA50_9BACT|nr:MAG: hypothetical protein UW39_C0022G0015 [Parcubacteria group bacterium GW2011_GWC2_44_17]KKT50435.1 MAG: hypothetical protein UW40_C0004G0025 [Parcubacteria group bacterium GW2011_GWF2_44_17]OGY72163.1 MAG: hypothetical protein A3E05_04605 [Candidatus Jacksonbacteria bacterium RIFCSPHIGHO2_12_FULL_44_12]OGY73519.1 MAG: hypothetical protein A3H61_03175 [Candidatus Jacksonbacteria bacterium RIFCSPLOWO2_02_FULL_44_20]OGY74381.1 MAG: hypothetical protein A3H07_04160 [Candidatus Jacksonbacteria
MKYFLTKYETITRTEKVQYEIEVPENIKSKKKYADNQIQENNYQSHKILDIVDSELMDEEIIDFRIKSA